MPGLVKSRSDETPKIGSFSPKPSKAAVVIVSGESGSGKKRFHPNRVAHVLGKNSTCIYHSLDDDKAKLIEQKLRPYSDSLGTSDSKRKNQERLAAMQNLAKVLFLLLKIGHTSEISTLHYNFMAGRNNAGMSAMKN